MKVSIFSADEMKELLKMQEVLKGVEKVYRLKAKGETAVWPHVCYNFEDEPKGVIDIKSGVIKGDIGLHGAKLLNTFWGNAGSDIPVFNGLLMLFDSSTGSPLGMMDASFITCMRTGAAGAIGVKVLARENTETLFVLGAGKQAIFQVAATLILMPQIKKVYIGDPLSVENAKLFVKSLPERLAKEFKITDRGYVSFIVAEDMEACVYDSDAIITITPSKAPVIMKSWVKPGTHLSCVGADMKGKEEIDPLLFQKARIFADDIDQCMNVGEMEIPILQGFITIDDVIGELGQVLEGQVEGRKNDYDITIFDATGIALLDLVTAKIAIDLSKENGLGQNAYI
ncbi:MAG: ornithine cyclodeaminase family protein [Aminipila sp.]